MWNVLNVEWLEIDDVILKIGIICVWMYSAFNASRGTYNLLQ